MHLATPVIVMTTLTLTSQEADVIKDRLLSIVKHGSDDVAIDAANTLIKLNEIVIENNPQ